jgi:hypothetical protein
MKEMQLSLVSRASHKRRVTALAPGINSFFATSKNEVDRKE